MGSAGIGQPQEAAGLVDVEVELMEQVLGVGKEAAEFGNIFSESVLEFDDARGDVDARAQFGQVPWFANEVVGPSVESSHDVLWVAFAGDKDNVGGLGFFAGAQAAAEFGAVEAGHDPVEKRDLWSPWGLQDVPGFRAIAGGDDLVAEFFDCRREQGLFHRVVIYDENSYGEAE